MARKLLILSASLMRLASSLLLGAVFDRFARPGQSLAASAPSKADLFIERDGREPSPLAVGGRSLL
jgi:hypothetical protein